MTDLGVPATTAPDWGKASTTLAAGLSAVVTLQLMGTVVQGLTLPGKGAGAVLGGWTGRVGVCFLANIGLVHGLALLASTALAAVAGHLSPSPARRRGTALRGANAGLAVVVLAGSLLAWRSHLQQFTLSDRLVPDAQRWSVFTYLAGNLVLGVLVLATCIATRRPGRAD